jgi:4,5-DOPA dioxygenase extradiol
MNAVARNAYTRFLGAYAAAVGKPRAIVVISAHWLARGSFVTGAGRPEQIHDFYGFPPELYRIRYAPPGLPELAADIAAALPGIAVDPTRGIDHAGWAVAMHMYPEQDVPLLQISLDVNASERGHADLGRALGRFRDEDVLLVGSGNIVHNLRDVSWDEAAGPFPWAVEADAWIAERAEAGNLDELCDYRACMPGWRRAIPTDDHYLPLLYVLGMRRDDETARSVFAELQNGSISMRCFEVA